MLFFRIKPYVRSKLRSMKGETDELKKLGNVWCNEEGKIFCFPYFEICKTSNFLKKAALSETSGPLFEMSFNLLVKTLLEIK